MMIMGYRKFYSDRRREVALSNLIHKRGTKLDIKNLLKTYICIHQHT
jgi:hypothetical protein